METYPTIVPTSDLIGSLGWQESRLGMCHDVEELMSTLQEKLRERMAGVNVEFSP